MRTGLFTIAIALALAGCASVGNESLRAETESSVQDKLVEGKSTKAEVRQAFGSPLKTVFGEGGSEVWTYEFTNVSLDAIGYVPVVRWFASSSSGTKKELVVLFDTAGVVRRFSMSESPVKLKSGLINW